MSTSTHDNFKLGKKVLLDARLAPVADYASLPNPNLPSNYIPESATILVQDTNKNYQAQIDPLNIPDLMWVDISPISSVGIGVSFIDITHSALSILLASKTLEKGAFYQITDRAEGGLVVQAIDIDRLSLDGKAAYFIADYTGVGDYSSAPLVVGTIQGVWDASIEGSLSNGDVVIWNGKNYQVQSAGSLAGTNPALNTLAYVLLSNSKRRGYSVEIDFVKYDIINDIIIERSDRRGNVVNSNGLNLFQWGNDNVNNNLVQNTSFYDCINNRGIINNNILSGSVGIVTDNSNIGSIQNNKFYNSGYTYTCNSSVLGQVLLNNCLVTRNENIVFLDTEEYESEECKYLFSTFKADINMSIDFDFAGTLTIPTNLNYVGRFKLKNSSGQVISKILNLPFSLCRFTVENTLNQSFAHTLIASATTGDLVSDSAATNVIEGRTISDDIIEYEPTGNVLGTPICRRYNIVKLA